MSLTLLDKKTPAVRSAAAWRDLPPRIKALYITTRRRTGGWLAEAFAADSAAEVFLEEAVGGAAGIARLHDEAFDAVLISHEPDDLDALALIQGHAAGGADEPMIVLGTQSEEEMTPLCYEVGADAYVCVHAATTRNLIWTIARAIQRHNLIRENQRFQHAEQTRLQREHEEATRLMQEQWAAIEEAERHSSAAGEAPSDASAWRIPLPQELIGHYRELLRTYVIMGSGNLSAELRQLAETLVAAGLTARQTMRLHLEVLEELVHGLGSRSTRHVMTRADLLSLELMMHLSEGYRRRYQERMDPPAQRILPGFEG